MSSADDRLVPKINILVEGQTEETFVRNVLSPYLMHRRPDLYASAIIVQTKRIVTGEKSRGGITNYGHFKHDAQRLLGDRGATLITSMIDLYKLPKDFPEFASSLTLPLRERVDALESAIYLNLGSPARFLPYISTHEFEALVMADLHILGQVVGADSSEVGKLRASIAAFASPEHINGTYAPSDRIEKHFPGYDKIRHGPVSAEKIGIGAIANMCNHFSNWLRCLEDRTKDVI